MLYFLTEIKLFVLNEEDYGRMLTPSTSEMSLEDDQIAFTDAKIDWMGKARLTNLF